MSQFDYFSAFSRNIGWVTRHEQALLRAKRVAIAGLGGVGGSHLLTLSRLGIGSFHLADFDTFELPNFNRQAGATISSLGQKKADVLTRMARDINPELDIKVFPQGVHPENIGDFLEGVDLYIDGLDFFALKIRRAVFAACAELDIPAVTAAPLGMGVALLNFLPGHMSFEDYFRLEGHDADEQQLRFLLGLSPAMLQGGYLVDPSTVDLARHRGPSTPMACELCAGVAATQALKILLHRGKVIAAPRGLHFDAYRNKLTNTWRPGGNSHPLQRLGLAIARKRFHRQFENKPTQDAEKGHPPRAIEAILEQARWAPSGDNTQPWRFEIVADDHLVIHGHDTRDHCVYDLEGRASQLSLGILLETVAIAASGHGLRSEYQRRQTSAETRPVFDVRFFPDPSLGASPLIPCIPLRSVQRRPMRTRSLSKREKDELEHALPAGYSLIWREGWQEKLKIARLMFHNAGLRLTMPEAYQVHRSVIEWNSRFSSDKIPDQAIGTDPLTTRLMRWTLQRWERVEFMNRYLAGTLLPRIQLDLIPGLACAAHFVIYADKPADGIDDYVAAGHAVQRFWLTATRLGLQLQPEMTPLIFQSYISRNIPFSSTPGMTERAKDVAGELKQLLGENIVERSVFMGRIGAGEQAHARSLRLPLAQLFLPEKYTLAATSTASPCHNRPAPPSAIRPAQPGGTG